MQAQRVLPQDGPTLGRKLVFCPTEVSADHAPPRPKAGGDGCLRGFAFIANEVDRVPRCTRSRARSSSGQNELCTLRCLRSRGASKPVFLIEKVLSESAYALEASVRACASRQGPHVRRSRRLGAPGARSLRARQASTIPCGSRSRTPCPTSRLHASYSTDETVNALQSLPVTRDPAHNISSVAHREPHAYSTDETLSTIPAATERGSRPAAPEVAPEAREVATGGPGSDAGARRCCAGSPGSDAGARRCCAGSPRSDAEARRCCAGASGS